MMKIGYITKPNDRNEYERWEDIQFLTEDQYNQKDRWAAMGYQRIVYTEVPED